jgi:hypothetical protein
VSIGQHDAICPKHEKRHQKVIAVIKRNQNGQLVFSDRMQVEPGDVVTLFPAPTGVVAVVGQVGPDHLEWLLRGEK